MPVPEGKAWRPEPELTHLATLPVPFLVDWPYLGAGGGRQAWHCT
jgi:hypothetical protein